MFGTVPFYFNKLSINSSKVTEMNFELCSSQNLLQCCSKSEPICSFNHPLNSERIFLVEANSYVGLFSILL